MTNEMVSIILPVFNGAKYIRSSIMSCLNQTYSNIELIVINDGSSDNTIKIVNDIAETDKRLKVVDNKVNLGLPKSLNIGHEIAKGNLLTWTSHDNRFLKNAILELKRAIETSGYDIVYSDYESIDEDDNHLRYNYVHSIDKLFFKNVIGCCFIYKRQVFFRNQGYRPNFELLEDYDFWLRAARSFNFFRLNVTLYQYREHSKSLTSTYNLNGSRNIEYRNKLISIFSDIVRDNFGSKEVTDCILFLHANSKTDFNPKFYKTSTILNFFKSISSSYPSICYSSIRLEYFKLILETIRKADCKWFRKANRIIYFSLQFIFFEGLKAFLSLIVFPIRK